MGILKTDCNTTGHDDCPSITGTHSDREAGRLGGMLMLFIAVCLITNSHLDLFYPSAAMGTGGALGNAIFFFISGYGLTSSFRRKQRSFPEWYHRRLLRIIPSVLVLMLVYPVLKATLWSWPWHAYDFLHPTWPFLRIALKITFLQVLLAAYFGYYVLLRSRVGMKGYLLILAGSFIPTLYVYCSFLNLDAFSMETEPFKWILWVQSMLLGGVLASRDPKASDANVKKSGFILLVLFVLYMLFEILFHKHLFLKFQLVLSLLTLGIVAALHLLSSSKVVESYIGSLPGADRILSFISKRTLEIYLMNAFALNPSIATVAFPANIALALTVLLIWSTINYYLGCRLREGIEYVEKRIVPPLVRAFA